MILVLQKNTTLEKLYLCGNEIGDKGGKAIGKALEVSFVLVSSFVFLCGYLPSLGNQPCCCGCATQKNNSITYLNLSFNNIGDVGAVALGEGIAVSPVLLFFLSFLALVTISSLLGNPRHLCGFGVAGEHDAQRAEHELEPDR